MDSHLDRLDWSLLQIFLAVAEEGSLSAAARRLGLSQPTLGRQIKQLEAHSGLELFVRQPRGLVLTPQGQAILPAAQRMADAMAEVRLAAAGRDNGLRGTLRITASHIVAHHHLPPLITRLREKAPEMDIVLIPSDSSENLLYREADIAVRMYRSEQLDIVTRRLGALEIGAFAAKSYLDRRGRPQSMQDLAGHDLIGFDTSDLILRGMRGAGLTLTREDFAIRCDDQVTYWQLLRSGCGIGFGQRAVAASEPLVEPILPDVPVPPLDVWLAAHEAMRRNPRVALAWSVLEEGLAPLLTQARP
ncbi:LysR family transcriptional regulator [Pseudooceanicola sp. C21-150M6]|uniref:LysR family transcriptional regulator n=1 Tax=Pseudooceanicola sp. C21-150M6 TaxID=3434355 RepID=UPI003D7FA173